MLEIEVKIKVGDIKPLREKLLSLGARVVRERYQEENILYDFPSKSLLQKREALRLRVIRRKAYLTFKGAPQKSRSFKIREEFESEIKNSRHLRKILKAVGMQPAFEYRKHRMLLRKDRVLISLDETSVGDFIELEGKRGDIIKLARSLGYARKDFITLSYVELIRRSAENMRKPDGGG